MMKATNYNQLPVNERADILWQEGKFIEAIELNDFDVSLYALNDKYFEMYYSVSGNRVEKIHELRSPRQLKRYNKGN
jgi:hypothetical protein